MGKLLRHYLQSGTKVALKKRDELNAADASKGYEHRLKERRSVEGSVSAGLNRFRLGSFFFQEGVVTGKKGHGGARRGRGGGFTARKEISILLTFNDLGNSFPCLPCFDLKCGDDRSEDDIGDRNHYEQRERPIVTTKM